jgi:hypothetical protein
MQIQRNTLTYHPIFQPYKQQLMETNKSDLQFENEFRKAKLIAETGAIFFEEEKISPDLEKEFLDYIEYFNRETHERELISVYDFIGKPEIRKNLKEDEIKETLNHLLNYMYEKNISLTTLAEVSDKELYRFIIEELFLYEIDNIRMTGMTHCFTYEDFHPNDVYDITHNTEEFINHIFKGNPEYTHFFYSPSFTALSGKKVSEHQLKYIIECFQAYYSDRDILSLKLLDPRIDDEYSASIEVFIEWKGNRSAEAFEQYSGKGIINLVQEYGYWSVCGVQIPGMII